MFLSKHDLTTKKKTKTLLLHKNLFENLEKLKHIHKEKQQLF